MGLIHKLIRFFFPSLVVFFLFLVEGEIFICSSVYRFVFAEQLVLDWRGFFDGIMLYFVFIEGRVVA
jgi:hypothetical protein